MFIILSGLLVGAAGAALVYFTYFWLAYRSKQKELDKLLAAVLKDAHAAEKALKLAKNMQIKSDDTKTFMSDDAHLTTLITIITKKFNGEIRLTGEDFQDVALDDYVTLYLDTATYDLILRSNNTSGRDYADLTSYMMPPGSDEDTFH